MIDTIPLLGISVWLIAKIFVLILMAIYVVFAVVVVRQIQLMAKTISIGFEFPIKVIASAHLLFAIAVFLFALFIL